jgi:hypothetical protein
MKMLVTNKAKSTLQTPTSGTPAAGPPVVPLPGAADR